MSAMTLDRSDLQKQPVELEGGVETRGEDGGRVGTPVQLRWSGLTFEVGAKKILDDVSGIVEGGEMLAVMGPSGELVVVANLRAWLIDK
jgi:hypothetical protein